MKPLSEGMIKRGGVNLQPSTPKPNIKPPPQRPPPTSPAKDHKSKDHKSKDHKLLQTMDAVVWAAEFKRIFPEADEDLMLTWFANAIMCGYDNGRRKLAKEMCRSAGVLMAADLAKMDLVTAADLAQIDLVKDASKDAPENPPPKDTPKPQQDKPTLDPGRFLRESENPSKRKI